LVERRERGKLKVYIGSAVGVGKTYRMLNEAQDLRRRGIDVVLRPVSALTKTMKTALATAPSVSWVARVHEHADELRISLGSPLASPVSS